MRRKYAEILLACCLSGCGAADDEPKDAGVDGALPWDQGGEDIPEYSLGRLLVTDPDVGITVVDLDTERVVGMLPMPGATHVFPAGSGRYSYVEDTASSALRVVDPGQWLLSHIDHFHVAGSLMGVRAEKLVLERLSSLTSHEGWVTVVDRTAGQVQLFQERGITAMAFRPVNVAVEPHDGIALVSHAHLIMSEPTAAGDWGIGIRDVVSLARAAHIAGCNAASSIAADTHDVYIACREGVLRLHWTGNDPAKLAQNWVQPIDATQVPNLVRTGVGVGGAVVRIGKRGLRLLPNEDKLPGELSFESDILDVQIRRQASAAIVLTADGAMHEVSLPAFHRGREVKVFDAISDSDRPPRFALSHAYAYLADPRSQEITAVRLRTMQVENAFRVGGRPSDVSVAGMPSNYTDDRE